MSETWLPFAKLIPGPPSKYGYSSRSTRTLGEIVGEVKHSMEGSYLAARRRMEDPGQQASWHFSVLKNGEVAQHYPLEYITWHAGATANFFHVGVEHEGVAGEPLTEAQYQGTLAISRALRELCPNIVRVPPSRQTNLREHNEFMATACPSGRIPWDRLIADLTLAPKKEEGPVAVTREEFERFVADVNAFNKQISDKVDGLIRWQQKVDPLIDALLADVADVTRMSSETIRYGDTLKVEPRRVV